MAELVAENMSDILPRRVTRSSMALRPAGRLEIVYALKLEVERVKYADAEDTLKANE